ncbi:MAG: ankyrin repeat domain-containing protein [Verrucomicrobia bacterium]|nr:MAG: ankyrin repeat domain-containing protein [Verrucomicrobiota bacterium]
MSQLAWRVTLFFRPARHHFVLAGATIWQAAKLMGTLRCEAMASPKKTRRPEISPTSPAYRAAPMRFPPLLLVLLLALTPASAAPTYQTIDDAIAHGDLADVRLHLAASPSSVNEGRDKTRSPLAQAVQRNKTEIALVLLEAGAKPDSLDSSQRSILHLAVERNNPTMLAALLKSGAKPDPRDKDGWTPLHHAAAKNQLASAKALLAGGANPMVLSELGGSPLHEAAASGGAEIVQLLLDHKVDPTLKSKQNVTALDIAKKYNNQAAIAILCKL